MAAVTVTIPNSLVPNLMPMMTEYLGQIGVDTSGMTTAQVGQTYIVERLRRDYVNYQRRKAQNDAQASVEQARQAAEAAVQSADQQARNDAGTIT